jgi:hypothetical protein
MSIGKDKALVKVKKTEKYCPGLTDGGRLDTSIAALVCP